MDEYGIFLSYNNQEEAFRIPVNPAELIVKEAGQGSTYNIVGGSEINVIQARKLTEISFESFFPSQQYPFVTNELLTIPEYLAYIDKWMESKRPIRFIYSGISYDPSSAVAPQEVAINMPVTIEDFEWRPMAGSNDIEYSISFKRYVFYAAIQTKVEQTATTTTVKKSATKRPNEKATPKTVKVAAGDSLWAIAQKQLGDGSRYKEIQKLNGISDAKAKSLQVGTVIKLPG